MSSLSSYAIQNRGVTKTMTIAVGERYFNLFLLIWNTFSNNGGAEENKSVSLIISEHPFDACYSHLNFSFLHRYYSLSLSHEHRSSHFAEIYC